jgi:hypothetical protein
LLNITVNIVNQKIKNQSRAQKFIFKTFQLAGYDVPLLSWEALASLLNQNKPINYTHGKPAFRNIYN